MSESINEKIALSQKHSSVDVGSDSTSQVISSISHELRTPLAIISSNIQLLKKFNYNLNERIVGETFMLCEEAVNSMTRFIDDIYFLNVSNKGEVKMNTEAVDLPLFFSKIVENVSDSDFNRKRLNVQFNFPESVFFCG